MSYSLVGWFFNLNQMKKSILSVFVMISVLVSCSEDDFDTVSKHKNDTSEITIFNKEGKAVAYYTSACDEHDIYLWNGDPVAYILDNKEVFGFNGEFLGWKESGVIYDLVGKRIGFEKNGLNIPTSPAPVKAIKEVLPASAIKKVKPAKPGLSTEWSVEPLDVFFYKGVL
ncbi:hypothetical protein DMA11_18150 [Marinilabiliaceae bacterium JC017]|nr:hypothetical protein DMA11_18150 [Marinilabiliaceae bacterium JC017]